MANRRKFLLGMGSLAAGGAAAMGTGAFTSVEAERTVSVSIADDSDALLGLEPTDSANGSYASGNGNEITVDISTGEATGVNDDAVTKIHEIFSVRNQGTQPVAVHVPPESVSPDRVGAADGNYDGFYLDPQFTDRPNGTYDGPVSGTVVYYLSGGEPDFEAAAERAFGDSGGIENYVLDVGQSMDFGLFIETEKNGVANDFDGEIALDLRAEADVVPSQET